MERRIVLRGYASEPSGISVNLYGRKAVEAEQSEKKMNIWGLSTASKFNKERFLHYMERECDLLHHYCIPPTDAEWNIILFAFCFCDSGRTAEEEVKLYAREFAYGGIKAILPWFNEALERMEQDWKERITEAEETMLELVMRMSTIYAQRDFAQELKSKFDAGM